MTTPNPLGRGDQLPHAGPRGVDGLIVGVDVLPILGVVAADDLLQMGGLLVEADVELPGRGHGHAADLAGHKQHRVGAVGPRRTQRLLHVRHAPGHGRVATVHIGPTEEHGVDPEPQGLGGRTGFISLLRRCAPTGRFDAVKSRRLEAPQRCVAGVADHGLVQPRLARIGRQELAAGQAKTGSGGNGQKVASVETIFHK